MLLACAGSTPTNETLMETGIDVLIPVRRIQERAWYSSCFIDQLSTAKTERGNAKMSARIEVHQHDRAERGTIVDVNNVDNELTIALNGQPLTTLGGPSGEGDSYNRNITDQLDSGQNLLVFSVVNFDEASPAKLDASVSIGADRINLNQADVGVPLGLYYQAFVYLEKV